MEPPRCLLLVDDDARNLLALEAILVRHRHRLVRASDGRRALELFERECPDIVLCDLMMPDMDGIEVLGRIRAHPDRWHTPVIMITAYGEKEHRLRALRAGVDEFLEKPIDAAILSARISTLLRLKRSRDDLARQHAELQRVQADQRSLMDFIVRDMTAPAKALETAIDELETRLGDERGVAEPVVEGMREALRDLGVMVQDLVWVSRLDSSATPIHRTAVAIDDLAARATEGLSKRAAGRRVALELARDVRVTVAADEGLLLRMLENLLDNAIRHAPPEGRVLVEVRRNLGAEIRVHNDGPTIAAIERERIFGKFVRGVTEPPSAGHPGLGLYFCKRVVEAHQGEITIVDVPGWSTCFNVWLPEPEPARASF